jgi:hypothetical protein
MIANFCSSVNNILGGNAHHSTLHYTLLLRETEWYFPCDFQEKE